MKRIIMIIFCFFLFLPLFAQNNNKTLAILDVSGENVSSTQQNLIYEYIVDRMNRSQTYTLVERSALNRALEELEISMSDIVDESTAVQVGKVAGAKYVLITALINEDSVYYLSMRVVNVETSKIEATAIEKTDNFSKIDILTQNAVDRLFDITNNTKPVEDTKVVEEPKVVVEEDKPKVVVKEEKPKEQPAAATDSPDKFLSLSGGGGITIPILDVTAVFDLGYQFTFNAYYCMKLGPGYGGAGIQTGAVFEFTRSLDDSEYKGQAEGSLIAIPAFGMIKYQVPLGDAYVGFQGGGGGLISIGLTDVDMRLSVPPEEQDIPPTLAIKPGITGGIIAGLKIDDNMGIALYGNYLHGFYDDAPFTGIIAGAQLEIRM